MQPALFRNTASALQHRQARSTAARVVAARRASSAWERGSVDIGHASSPQRRHHGGVALARGPVHGLLVPDPAREQRRHALRGEGPPTPGGTQRTGGRLGAARLAAAACRPKSPNLAVGLEGAAKTGPGRPTASSTSVHSAHPRRIARSPGSAVALAPRSISRRMVAASPAPPSGPEQRLALDLGAAIEEQLRHVAAAGATLRRKAAVCARPPSGALASAPRSSSSLVISRSSTAHISAVAPASFLALTSAPESIRRRCGRRVPVERGIHQRSRGAARAGLTRRSRPAPSAADRRFDYCR